MPQNTQHRVHRCRRLHYQIWKLPRYFSTTHLKQIVHHRVHFNPIPENYKVFLAQPTDSTPQSSQITIITEYCTAVHVPQITHHRVHRCRRLQYRTWKLQSILAQPTDLVIILQLFYPVPVYGMLYCSTCATDNTPQSSQMQVAWVL